MDDFNQLVNDNPADSTVSNETPTDTTVGGTTDNSVVEAPQAQTNPTDTDDTTGNTTPEDTNSNAHNSNQAFAAMRVQTKKYQSALAAVLQQHGLDPSLAGDPDQLIQNAENARLEEEAKAQKVPPELLKRLTQLERSNIETQQKHLSDLALAGFQQVKDKYSLSTQELAEFAKQLQDSGTNPFEQEMDLDQHYKMHNLDKIIAAETQKAVENALKNQNTALQHSTAPSKNLGKDSNGVDTIDTMAKFERFLQSHPYNG